MTAFINSIDKTWTLFLDRDGVINDRIIDGYVTQPEGFHFIPGVLEALATLSKLFGKVILVTNQQGIGKGLMTTDQLNAIHHHMVKEIEQSGGRLDAVYFCPDLKSKPENCRKPGITMALQAKADFPEIDFSKSVMVGDSESDMEFGENAGMISVYAGVTKPLKVKPDLKVQNLAAFAHLIEKSHSS
jgi:histidinol-phosphate phosphatase family protein